MVIEKRRKKQFSFFITLILILFFFPASFCLASELRLQSLGYIQDLIFDISELNNNSTLIFDLKQPVWLVDNYMTIYNEESGYVYAGWDHESGVLKNEVAEDLKYSQIASLHVFNAVLPITGGTFIDRMGIILETSFNKVNLNAIQENFELASKSDFDIVTHSGNTETTLFLGHSWPWMDVSLGLGTGISSIKYQREDTFVQYGLKTKSEILASWETKSSLRLMPGVRLEINPHLTFRAFGKYLTEIHHYHEEIDGNPGNNLDLHIKSQLLGLMVNKSFGERWKLRVLTSFEENSEHYILDQDDNAYLSQEKGETSLLRFGTGLECRVNSKTKAYFAIELRKYNYDFLSQNKEIAFDFRSYNQVQSYPKKIILGVESEINPYLTGRIGWFITDYTPQSSKYLGGNFAEEHSNWFSRETIYTALVTDGFLYGATVNYAGYKIDFTGGLSIGGLQRNWKYQSESSIKEEKNEVFGGYISFVISKEF